MKTEQGSVILSLTLGYEIKLCKKKTATQEYLLDKGSLDFKVYRKF